MDIPRLFLEESKIYNHDLYTHITNDVGPVLYNRGKHLNVLEIDFTSYVKELSNILSNKFGFINDMSLENNLVKPYIESLVYDYDCIKHDLPTEYVYLAHNLNVTINNFFLNENIPKLSNSGLLALNNVMLSTNTSFKNIVNNTILKNKFIKKETIKIFPFKWKNKVIEDKDILRILITWN